MGFALALGQNVLAQATWTGGDIDDNLWMSLDNWGGVSPSGQDVLFGNGSTSALDRSTQNDFSGASIGKLTFLNTASGNFTISGNGLTVTDNVTVQSVASGTLEHLVSADLSWNGDRNFIVNGDEVLHLSGTVTSTNNRELVKRGSGTLKLTGTSTIRDFEIDEGTVQFTEADNLGTRRVFLGNDSIGATLDFIGDSGSTVTINTTDVQLRSRADPGVASSILANGVTDSDNIVINAFVSNGNGDTLILGGENSGENTVSSSLGDSGPAAAGLTKQGGGTWVLTGSNSYLGSTTISDGTLRIDGDQSGAAGDVLVSSNGTLGGNGTIGGNTTVSGTHTAGTVETVDTQTFRGNLSYASGSSVTWNLIDESSSAGVGWDLFVVENGGSLDFDAITNFVIEADNAIDLSGAASWNDLLVWDYSGGALAAGFASGDFLVTVNGGMGALPAGGSFSLVNDGAQSGIFLSYTATPVPEPGSLSLLSVAILGSSYLYWRRRKSKDPVLQE